MLLDTAAVPAVPPSAQAMLASEMTLLLTFLVVALIAMTVVYLTTFLTKILLLREFRGRAEYPTIVRSVVAVSIIICTATSYFTAGKVMAIAVLLGALAAPLLHDVMDAIRAVRRFAVK